MSRQSIAPNRALTLPEELEKLEQSITLTLQEIDANFSRAHRIVTSSILPIVQQYATHSNSVWESSRFWKDFFEASANISLTGYEEAADSSAAGDDTLRSFGEDNDDDDRTRSTAADQDVTTSSASSALERPNSRFDLENDSDANASFLMDSPTATAKITPRPTRSSASKPQNRQAQSAEGPATPRTRPSPFIRPRQPEEDPLLHRVLDKNYRVQATPRTAHRSPAKPSARPASSAKPTSKPEATRTLHPALDSSPFSPGMQAPALRAEIFGQPSARKQRRGGAGTPLAPSGPRTPGVSVQRNMRGIARDESGFTPGARTESRGSLFIHQKEAEQEEQTQADTISRTPPLQRQQQQQQQPQYQQEWYDSDDETADASAFFGAMSPPKTVALNFPPRLVQTPAREASRRMVDDLMRTAGGESATDEMEQPAYEELDMELGEDSPSVVRVTGGADESF